MEVCAISSESLTAVAQSCPLLEELCFENLTGEISPGVDAIGRSCSCLSYFSVRWCATVSESAWLAVARGCPKLRSLTVHNCNGVTDDVLTALAGLPLLTHLYLRECENVSDLDELAQSPCLRSVDFTRCFCVAKWSMKAMDTSRKEAGLPEVTWEGEYDYWSDEPDAESE